MKIYVAVGNDEPFARTELEEVQDHLQKKYATYSNTRPLTFDRSHVYPYWAGYDWTAVDSDGRASEISEKIYEVDLPVGSFVGPPNDDFGVFLELRVTTGDKKTSYQEVQSREVWGNRDLRPAIIDLFAKKAGHVLAASINEE